MLVDEFVYRMINMKTFARFLETRRMAHAMSTAQLATAGEVSPAAISRIESGDLEASRELVVRLARALAEAEEEWLLVAGYLSEELQALATTAPSAAVRGLKEAVPEVAALQAQLLVRLEPIVEETVGLMQTERGSLLPNAEARAWQQLCSAKRSDRSVAADAVLIEISSQLVEPETRSAWSHWLPALRDHVGDKIPADTAELARQLCRQNEQMLGPTFESLSARPDRYAQGQYFTPTCIAEYMASFIDASTPQTILDPAVGAGVLLAACGAKHRLVGLDISPTCIAMTTAGLSARGACGMDLRVGDFIAADDLFAAPLTDFDGFDTIICNPPYVRHHLLGKTHKKQLVDRYSSLFGTSVSTLSTSYVYFFLEALRRLRDGGVLVFITPADYLDVRFGASLKSTFQDHATIEDITLFDRDALAFAGVLTTSAITVLRKVRPSVNHRGRFLEATLVDGRVAPADGTNRLTQKGLDVDESWTLHFGQRRESYDALIEGRPRAVSDYLRIRRGIATGANKFFVLTEETVTEWGIEREHLQPVIASAKDLPSGIFSREDWEKLRDRGRPCWLLNCTLAERELGGSNILRYLKEGVRQEVHQRFNCRTRNPWYRAEQVPPPDVIITYMNRGRTRFVKNESGCRVMSVFLNGFLRPDGVDIDALLDALNGEDTSKLIQKLGRTYGGGLGKIEPRELANLPMPEIPRGRTGVRARSRKSERSTPSQAEL